jgi:serine/threonine-protein kinase
LIGELIDGRYKVVEVIGEGGMGLVYRAENERLKRPVAIKVLQRDYSAIAEVGRRFEREAVAIARLDHPNCVAVQDFGRLPDGSLYLVMSYLHGVLLSDAIAQGRFPVARALHIARHLLCGLAHAHNAGIIHRDVKPENVMLVKHEGDADFAKLFDFGIAKLTDGESDGGDKLTRVGQRFGTPAYMSPEQSMGRPLDARTDLYSLTVVLFEMIAGKPPFWSEDPPALLAMQAAKPPPTLAQAGVEVAPEIEALVKRGLAKDPAQRFPDAAAYIEALDACIQPAPIAVKPRRPASAIVRLVRKRPRFAGGVVIALLVAGAGFGLWRALKPDHAAHARALLAGGRPQEAASYLEERLQDIADDAPAQLALGHAYSAERRYNDALQAYERVRSLDRTLADDRVMRTNLMLMLDDERNATAAARFLIQFLDDEGAREKVVEIASRYKTLAHRDAMRDLAETLGLSSRVDRLASYSLDLEQGGSCADRQHAVARLRALADPAAIAALKSAQGKKPNACLRDDAADAVRYLETLAPSAGTQTPQ